MKKYIFIFITILLVPLSVLAGTENDDVKKTKIIACEYNVKPKYANVNVYFKIKSVLLKGDDNKYYIENYGYKTSKYELCKLKLDYVSLFDVKTNEEYMSNYPIAISLGADTLANYYKQYNNCPFMQFYQPSSGEGRISFTDNEKVNSQNEYSIAEANKVEVGKDVPKPTTPKITKTCDYNITSNNLEYIDSVNINFFMKDNKKKYMKLTLVERGTDYSGTTEIDKDGGHLVLSRSQGMDYTFIVPKEEVGKIFNNVNGTTFECLSSNDLGVILENYTDGMFKITTDMKEVKDWGEKNASAVNEGNISYKYEEVEIKPIKPDALECTGENSLLGSTSCASGQDCEPAFYVQVVFNVMKYVAIILLIVMSTFDFLGAVGSSDDGAMKKAMNKCIIRLILCVLIFFIPTILEYIFTLIKVYTPSTCGIK